MAELPDHSAIDPEIELRRTSARIAAEWEHAATSAAVRTIWWPALVGVGCLSSMGTVSLSEDWPSIVMAVMTALYVSIIVGCVIGSLAYSVFKTRGRAAVIRVAIALALIFDFTVCGWATVLIQSTWHM